MRDFYGKRSLKKFYYIIENVKEYLTQGRQKKKIIRNKTILKQCKESTKTLYIIRRENEAGFFSNYFFVLGHIIIATANNWIPIVDMQNYKTPYNEKDKIDGTYNAWEYYFYQPEGIKLEDIKVDETVYASSSDYPLGIVPSYGVVVSNVPSKKMIDFLTPYLPKIKDTLVTEFNTEIQYFNLKECVGVHVRGTDMKNTDAHPIPPSVLEVFSRIDKLFDEYGKMPIFLCTDEVDVVKSFESKYKEVRYSNSYRSVDGNEGIHLEQKRISREKHKYLLGKEVLRDAYCLSKCRILVAGKSNVAFAAMVMNENKYEKVLIR